MKKRFFLLTAMAAVLFSGCQQEDDFRSMSADSQDITKVIITAELESTKATRTSTVSDGTSVNILWSEDDSLSVLMNGLKSHALFTIHDIDEKGTSAHFIGQNVIISGGTSGSDAEDAANVAIYPYTADANITDKAYNAETGEHSFCMPFPHVQQYAADGSVGNGAFPMVAVSESNYHVGFGFRPVAAGMRIGLKGEEGVKIKTIMVQSSKQKISGKAAVTASYAGMPTIAIDQTEGINNIVLDCGEEGVALNPETVTQFTVALPPMSVEANELTFTIYDTEGGFMEYVYDGAFTFERNTHYNLNKIGTYVATETNPLVLALKKAGEGDVVNFTLAGDMKVTSQLSVGWESLNLDLNGFTLDLGDNALRFDGGYAFTSSVINISNGTIKSNYSYCIFSYGIPSAITLTDVTLEGKGGIHVQGLAKNLTLNNVTMNVTGNGLYESLTHTQNSKVTINGGTYKVGTLFNSFEQADDITIIGGKFNKTYNHANVVWESREGEADADVYPYTATELSYTVDDAGNVTIYSAAGLKWLAEQVNGGDSFSKKTVTLAADIDLAGEEHAIIGLPDAPFSGTFDGQDHTIKNLDIVETEAKEDKAYIGFFGYAKNATIKNVTFENVNLNIPCLDIDHSQGHIGAVAGSLEGTSLIEDVTVKGNIKVEATFDANGASRVAVVAGGNSYGDVTMRNVHVVANEGSYLKSNNNVGALAGQLQGKNVFENCSSNINVTGKKFFAGGIIGLAAGNSTFTDCHTTGNVTITAGREGNANDHYRVGGIAGGWADNKTTPCVLTDCTYTGTVSGTNADGSVANPLDYSGYVGRGYTLANNEGSTVIIDGVKYIQIGNTPPYGNYNVVDTNYPIFIGETGYATLAEACAAAVDGDVIVISEGEYTLPYGLNHDNSGKLTIKGAGKEKTNILGTKNSYNNSGLPGNYANEMELVFEDLTYTTVNEGYYGGFGHAKSVAFDNCKIVGQMYCHSGAPHTFTDCTIDPLTGYLYTYASNCVFTGCNFEASEGKALQVYAEAAGTFKTTITNCTFAAAKQAQTWDGKPVTGIDVNSANGAVMVVEITDCSQEGFPVGLNSNSALWNVKSTTADITVTVDGKKVWPEAPVFNITNSNTEALTTAVATPDATVEIAAGTYTFPKSFAKGVTVVCEEGTVFDGGSSAISLDINGATIIGAEFTSSADRVITGTVNGTIKDCTFTGDRALRYCYAGETCVFENCVFDGVVYGVHFDGGENDATFRNCTFSGFNAFGHAITLLTLENCNFKSNGKTDYNGVNLWGNTNLVGTKFYFDGTVANEWISAASAGIEISFTNCEIVNSEKSLTDWLDESNDPGTVFTINGDTYTTK